MSQQTILVDRSRHELFFDCPREYYWTYAYAQKGIVPKGKATYFITGEAIHVGIQSSMLSRSWTETKAEIEGVFTTHAFGDKEQRDLALALVYAWRKLRMESFLQEYAPLDSGVEREIVVPIFEDERYKVLLMSRPDIIVKRLLDDAILVWELKSTAAASSSWIKKWEHALQLLLQCFAVQSVMPDRQVVGCTVEGFVKGSKRVDSADGKSKLSNNLIYNYVKKGDGFIIPHQFSAGWKKGWSKELVSGHMGLESWIDSLPAAEVQDYLRLVPPLLASPDAMASVCRQVAFQAIKNFEAAQVEDLNEVWPQNFDNCYKYGEESACPFVDVCFQHTVGEDPLASGLYKVREPNHAFERSLSVEGE